MQNSSQILLRVVSQIVAATCCSYWYYWVASESVRQLCNEQLFINCTLQEEQLWLCYKQLLLLPRTPDAVRNILTLLLLFASNDCLANFMTVLLLFCLLLLLLLLLLVVVVAGTPAAHISALTLLWLWCVPIFKINCFTLSPVGLFANCRIYDCWRPSNAAVRVHLRIGPQRASMMTSFSHPLFPSYSISLALSLSREARSESSLISLVLNLPLGRWPRNVNKEVKMHFKWFQFIYAHISGCMCAHKYTYKYIYVYMYVNMLALIISFIFAFACATCRQCVSQ